MTKAKKTKAPPLKQRVEEIEQCIMQLVNAVNFHHAVFQKMAEDQAVKEKIDAVLGDTHAQKED